VGTVEVRLKRLGIVDVDIVDVKLNRGLAQWRIGTVEV
jgi:hypothetical protein